MENALFFSEEDKKNYQQFRGLESSTLLHNH